MPQILIVTDDSEETARTVVYRERIAPSDFDSTHFTGQLTERVGWAVDDADRLEHAGAQGVIVTRPKAVRPST
jgi:predicted TIM-barrel enzyme